MEWLRNNAKFVFVMLVVGFVFYLALHPDSLNKKSEPISTPTSKPEVHVHAGFQVYEDGIQKDFSDFKYMHLEPCSEDSHAEDKNDPEHEQEEKAHLHDGIGDVVHSHREGAVWGDLFKNIDYPIASPSAAYVNKEKFDGDILNYPIKAYDSVIIFIGKNKITDEIINNSVTVDHIKEVESKSENCGS